MRFVASVSFGKDSLAMLHLLLEQGRSLHDVVFYDTGAEFDCIYRERDRILPLLEERHIKYTELHPAEPFFYQMFAHPVHSRKTGEVHKHGYGWCGGSCRWGTTYKNIAIAKYLRGYEEEVVQYVGIAADEKNRIGDKCYPLLDYNMTEKDCLEYCYEQGHEWLEDGVRLYDVLDRVSCWCCRNKNQKELKAIHDNLPRYWERLEALEAVLGNMKGKSLSEVVSCS